MSSGGKTSITQIANDKIKHSHYITYSYLHHTFHCSYTSLSFPMTVKENRQRRRAIKRKRGGGDHQRYKIWKESKESIMAIIN